MLRYYCKKQRATPTVGGISDGKELRMTKQEQNAGYQKAEEVRKKTAKEILQRLYDKCYEVQGLREGYAHIIPLDILILAKEYGVEIEE